MGREIFRRADPRVVFLRREDFMSCIIKGTDSAGALLLKRDSAAAAIKKALELMGDGCRDVGITDPDGRIYSPEEYDRLRATERA
jgi:hypothetical protein